jgi:hypothetical protein
VIVAVLGAVLVTALTPLGASLRELLFHTRATVAGSVTIDGKPAASVHLKLDGADSGDTDAGGRFLLTEVSKGQNRLHLELLGTKPRHEVFSVASGQTALQVGNLDMEPLVRLAYRPSVQLSAQGFDYNITLWIIGDPDVLSRIKSVSYTLPTPLSSRPVSGADANHAFCYRQTGTLPLEGSSGNGAPSSRWPSWILAPDRSSRSQRQPARPNRPTALHTKPGRRLRRAQPPRQASSHGVAGPRTPGRRHPRQLGASGTTMR